MMIRLSPADSRGVGISGGGNAGSGKVALINFGQGPDTVLVGTKTLRYHMSNVWKGKGEGVNWTKEREGKGISRSQLSGFPEEIRGRPHVGHTGETMSCIFIKKRDIDRGRSRLVASRRDKRWGITSTGVSRL